jgi:hypothetical protein
MTAPGTDKESDMSGKGDVGSRSRTLRLGAAMVLASSLVLGCGDRGDSATTETCLPPSTVDPSAPITRIGVHFVAGSAPLLMGNEVTSANGATFKTTKARLYLSQVALIGEGGARVGAELVDAQGNRLPYGVTLLDLERPESLNVHLKAPAGNYQGMAVSVGVPETCGGSGSELNHADASAMEAPLDVDSDMYWSWNSGYVFLKFEGQVQDAGAWEGFFYHVGDDKRFAALELDMPFTLSPEGGAGPELIADFNRLLVSPTGASNPDITNEDTRRVHGGALADSLAENIRGSQFLRLVQGHQ